MRYKRRGAGGSMRYKRLGGWWFSEVQEARINEVQETRGQAVQ